MPTPPTTREAIKRLLREHGPMTVLEIAEEMKKPASTVSSCISTARAGKKKHFYVAGHRPQVGISGMPAGLYAVGNRPDAEPPEHNRKAIGARYYQNNKARIKLRRGVREINPFTSLISQITA